MAAHAKLIRRSLSTRGMVKSKLLKISEVVMHASSCLGASWPQAKIRRSLLDKAAPIHHAFVP
jgi:hypothetical protein